MDNSITLAVTLALLAAFGQWRLKSDAPLGARIVRGLLVCLATGLAAFGASYAVHSFNNANARNAALDKILQQAESTPLIGAILNDEPQYKDQLREAVKSNTGAGRQLLVQLRSKYANPAVWAAPDEAVMSAFSDSAKVRDYLSTNNARLCSEYMMAGIENLDELTPEGKHIFDQSLKSMEKVYLEGKGRPPRAIPFNDEQVKAVYQLMGLTTEETDALNNKGTDEARCRAGAKIYGALGKLKQEYRSIFARFMLAPT